MKNLFLLASSVIVFYMGTIGMACSQTIPETVQVIAPVKGLKESKIASSTILSSGKIEFSDVVYQAGGKILLIPGFEVKPGAIFHALIQKKENYQNNAEHLGNSELMIVSPNPTSGFSRIEYQLQKNTRVSIELLDLNGNVILRPVNNVAQEEGKQHVDLNLDGLQPGVYLCVLSTENGNSIFKVVKANK